MLYLSTDVDECALKIHNCIPKAKCLNILGGFDCECPDPLGSQLCTGYCMRNGVTYENGENVTLGCRNCICLVSACNRWELSCVTTSGGFLRAS